MAAEDQLDEMKMDVANLYQEEVFTDRRVGSLLRLTPVTPAGGRDSTREVVFVGQTQILTQAGALPLSFEIPGQNLDEACANFAAAADKAVNDTMERLKELRREAAAGLIVPEGGGFGGGGMGGPGGGLGGPGGPGFPGGGKIQLR